ncbi:MAG TPA: cytochrome P460 family protein [Pyrinomonadaceae bacterium]|jgi:hypothetical protein
MNTVKKITVVSLVLLSFVFAAFRLTSSYAREGTATIPPVHVPSAPELKDIRDYKAWTRVHPTALKLPTPLDILCAMPTPPRSIESSQNPHRRRYFVVYVNETGREAMMSQLKPAFPEGSIIVKEKLEALEDTSPEMLTVMAKREKGFNPESGDWEYMVVSGSRTKIEGRGKLANCQSCHVLKGETDYVFRSYLPESVREKLR